jgi:hypothetical protein
MRLPDRHELEERGLVALVLILVLLAIALRLRGW